MTVLILATVTTRLMVRQKKNLATHVSAFPIHQTGAARWSDTL